MRMIITAAVHPTTMPMMVDLDKLSDEGVEGVGDTLDTMVIPLDDSADGSFWKICTMNWATRTAEPSLKENRVGGDIEVSATMVDALFWEICRTVVVNRESVEFDRAANRAL